MDEPRPRRSIRRALNVKYEDPKSPTGAGMDEARGAVEDTRTPACNLSAPRAGNLTNVVYPALSLRYGFDALNRGTDSASVTVKLPTTVALNNEREGDNLPRVSCPRGQELSAGRAGLGESREGT